MMSGAMMPLTTAEAIATPFTLVATTFAAPAPAAAPSVRPLPTSMTSVPWPLRVNASAVNVVWFVVGVRFCNARWPPPPKPNVLLAALPMLTSAPVLISCSVPPLMFVTVLAVPEARLLAAPREVTVPLLMFSSA